MDVINNLLFWLHLTGLAAGGVAAFGMPIVGSRLATANAETRPLLFSLGHTITRVGQVAMGLLIITGPLLVWLKFGGTAGLNGWFWLKMVLFVLLLAVIITGGVFEKRLEKGDESVLPLLPRLAVIDIVLLLGVIVSAVFAFN
ncbi:MAG TPA: hypothetical protein VHB74_07325 [Devosia sp.]|nr:hypothetical protein [Devosia sp.]